MNPKFIEEFKENHPDVLILKHGEIVPEGCKMYIFLAEENNAPEEGKNQKKKREATKKEIKKANSKKIRSFLQSEAENILELSSVARPWAKEMNKTGNNIIQIFL